MLRCTTRSRVLTSGAHIDLSTTSGTNVYHGDAVRSSRHQLDQCGAVLLSSRMGGCSRGHEESWSCIVIRCGWNIRRADHQEQAVWILSRTQHVQVSDQEIGDSFLDVPVTD